MTDRELRRLGYLPRERKRLREEERAARMDYGRRLLWDPAEPPRTGGPLTRPVSEAEREEGVREARLRWERARRGLAECEAELERLNGFLDGIEDPLLRALFDLRYRRGKTWLAVSLHFGRRSDFWSRDRAKKYLRELEKIGSPPLS